MALLSWSPRSASSDCSILRLRLLGYWNLHRLFDQDGYVHQVVMELRHMSLFAYVVHMFFRWFFLSQSVAFFCVWRRKRRGSTLTRKHHQWKNVCGSMRGDAKTNSTSPFSAFKEGPIERSRRLTYLFVQKKKKAPKKRLLIDGLVLVPHRSTVWWTGLVRCRHPHKTKPSFTNRLCDCCACREEDPASSSPREQASSEDAASSDSVACQRSFKFSCAAGHRKSFRFLRASFHGNTRHSWNHDVFEFCSSCGDHLEIHSQRVQPLHSAFQQKFNVCFEALSLLVRVCLIRSTYPI